MKFKNYVNSLTGDNRIFSNKEITNMSVKEAHVNEDGSFELKGIDPYDFTHNEYYENVHDLKSLAKETVKAPYTLINNIAKGQQDAEQLENFLFSLPIKYSQEELEEIRRKFMHKRNIGRNK